MLQVPVTFIYGEHDWMNPAAGMEVGKILDKVRERKVSSKGGTRHTYVVQVMENPTFLMSVPMLASPQHTAKRV